MKLFPFYIIGPAFYTQIASVTANENAKNKVKVKIIISDYDRRSYQMEVFMNKENNFQRQPLFFNGGLNGTDGS